MPLVTRHTLLLLLAITPIHNSIAVETTQQPLQQLELEASNGDAKAQLLLAKRFYSGEDAPQDYIKAAHWYQKSATNGVAAAQLTLSLIYIKGQGVEKDDQLAIHWLTQAAEQKLAMAQYLLGIAYLEGHGLKSDMTKAYMWFDIAAAMDYPDAVEARKKLAKKISAKSINRAEIMATEWWTTHHQ